jgi:ribosomal protein S18 acetylase RimI-like enzyme
MSDLEFRRLLPQEIGRIREIDRSERVTVGYRVVQGELEASAVHWDVPSFRTEGSGEHTISAQVRFCEKHLEAGALALGAFRAGILAGIGLMTPGIRPGVAQLAYLHVSREHRRAGIATRLVAELIRFAAQAGARQVYVSSVPSESAVGFYRSCGFRLATPLPELLEQEPEDIHMILDLPGDSGPD